jgi:hypothetical protein
MLATFPVVFAPFWTFEDALEVLAVCLRCGLCCWDVLN